MADNKVEFYWWEYHGKTGKHRREKWLLYAMTNSGKTTIGQTFIRPTHLPTEKDIEVLELTGLLKKD